MSCKTQVINNAQGQAPPQRTSQRFVTLSKAIVGLLWLKFVRSLVSAMGACSPSSKNELQFRKLSARCVPRLLSDQKKKALTEEKLAQLYWTALQHPPYSPDLSPCDYHLFGPLKEALRGQRFEDDEEVQNFVRNWLQKRPPSFYDAGVKKLPIC